MRLLVVAECHAGHFAWTLRIGNIQRDQCVRLHHGLQPVVAGQDRNTAILSRKAVNEARARFLPILGSCADRLRIRVPRSSISTRPPVCASSTSVAAAGGTPPCACGSCTGVLVLAAY